MKKLSTEEMNRLSVGEFHRSPKLPLTVVLDNVRSQNNIGSIFRTADAFRVEHIALCGICSTPPHREIHKTALGAEESVAWSYHEDTDACVRELKERGYKVFAIEQVDESIKLGTQASRLHGIPGTQASRLQGNDVSGTQASRLHAAGTAAHPVAGETPALPDVRDRGYLPHFENRAIQFITFRLFDSVPKELIEEWKSVLSVDNNAEEPTDVARQMHKLIDRFEDSGHGQCFLADSRVADMMEQTLRHDDGRKYDLISYCVMPNHVHVMIRVYEGVSLSSILHTWRSYSAHEANKILGRSGEFWMKDYYDRYIRDAQHYAAVVQYIKDNPAKAGLGAQASRLHVASPVAGLGSTVGYINGTQASRLHAAGTAAHPVAGETLAYPKVAVVFGNEVEGVQDIVLELCDGALEIPQFGTKHSLNVSCAAAIVIWEMYQTLRSPMEE